MKIPVNELSITLNNGLEYIITISCKEIIIEPENEDDLIPPEDQQYLLAVAFIFKTYEQRGIIVKPKDYLRIADYLCNGINSGKVPEFKTIGDLSRKEFDDVMKQYDGREQE